MVSKTDGGHEALRFFTYMRDKKGFIGKARMREWLKLHKIQCDEVTRTLVLLMIADERASEN